MTDLAFNQYICPDGFGVLPYLDAAAGLGARHVSVTWSSLDEVPLPRLKSELAARGLAVTSLNSAGRFTWEDRAQARAQADLNARLVDAAAELGAMVLTVITGGIGGLLPGDARARVADGLATLDTDAAAAGVRLGLEPIHPVGLIDKGCINTLAQARTAIEGLRATGLMLDTYHSWWDPDLRDTVRRAPVELIQVCNVDQPPGGEPRRSPVLDAGLLPMAEMLGWFRKAGYARPFEFEIFAADHGQDDPRPLMAAAWEFAAALPA